MGRIDGNSIYQYVKSIAHERVGGLPEERAAAEKIQSILKEMAIPSSLDEFTVWTYDDARAVLSVPGFTETISASAIGLSGSTPKEGIIAPMRYVESAKEDFLFDIAGKIIVSSAPIPAKSYELAKKKGAVGVVVISPPGKGIGIDAVSPECFETFGKLPMAAITYEDGLKLLKKGVKQLHLAVSQHEYRAVSQNVIAEIKGTEFPDELIVIGAHYDSVRDTVGAHDNAAGAATILELARCFKAEPPLRTLRFIWFGSEELGLLGSLHYVQEHSVDNVKLMINLDVGGGIVGNNRAIVMADDSLKSYIEILGKEEGMGLDVKQTIYSSDCMPFTDNGVPSVSICRFGGATYYLHSPKDEIQHIAAEPLAAIGEFAFTLAQRVANSRVYPFSRDIPKSICKQIDEHYTEILGMKRKGKDD